MSLDPKLLPVAPPLPPMPPPVDITDIPLPTPDPISYFDYELGEEVPIPETIPGYVPDWADELEEEEAAAAAIISGKKLSRPDAAPHLQSVLDSGPMTNGFSTDPSLWLGKPIETHPHYLIEYDSAPPTKIGHPEYPVSVPGLVSVVHPDSAPAATANGKKSGSEKPEYSVRYFMVLTTFSIPNQSL